MTNLLESWWEHVVDEASQEFNGMQGLELAILGAERNGIRLDVNETAVGNRNAVRVATEIPEEMLGATEGSLDVHAPTLVSKSSGQLIEGLWIAESIVTTQLIARLHSVKEIEGLAAKDFAHDLHGEQVLDGCGSPHARGVKDAGGDDGVHVRVKAKVARPCVQHHRDAEQPAESRVSQLEERFARGAEQGFEEKLREGSGERTQLTRKGEDDVEVADGQDASGASSDPLLLGERLALGAMAIAAGVESGLFETAVAAHVEMAAERSRATELDGRKHPPLRQRQVKPLLELGAVRSDDVGNLETRPPGGCRAVGHGAQLSRSSASCRAGSSPSKPGLY